MALSQQGAPYQGLHGSPDKSGGKFFNSLPVGGINLVHT